MYGIGNVENDKYPYIIDVDLLKKSTAFPTHTHGLTEIGLPEFILDPAAFGPQVNCVKINDSYDYFNKPDNEDKLKAILDGKTIKLSGKQLRPKNSGIDPNVYCYRLVSLDFEAVKLAYGPGVKDVMPGMKVIQIYIEGDDFALTDEYYIGGVKPD